MRRALLLTAILVCAAALAARGQRAAGLRGLIDDASAKTIEYAEGLKNLSARERKTSEIYDRRGRLERRRVVVADLVIYESPRPPRQLAEFRNILEVDGRPLKNSERRTVRLFEKLSDAATADDELKKMRRESSRYDIGLSFYGQTLFQAIPFAANLVRSFVFEDAGRARIEGREAVGVAFRQIASNPALDYRIKTPPALEETDVLTRGTAWVDAAGGRLLRLFVEVTIESPRLAAPFVFWREEYEYAPGEFAIYTPRRIVTTQFTPQIDKRLGLLGAGEKIAPKSVVQARVTNEYGPFTRFEVTTEVELKTPGRP